MTVLWRGFTKTSGNNVAEYCLNHQVYALGWSLCDDHIKKHVDRNKIIEARSMIKSLEDYKSIIDKYHPYGNKLNDNITRLAEQMKPGDLLWMRNKGQFYLGRVGENSQYRYNHDSFSLDNDATNQRTDIQWVKIGDLSRVPGSLANRFISGHTLSRIHDETVRLVSMLLYNKYQGHTFYSDISIEGGSDGIFSLLTYSELEDIVAMYLFRKKGYVAIPSTNKKSTPLYEFVMLNPANGESVFLQVKQGNVNINAEDYQDLDGESYLFTSHGQITNRDISDRIHTIDRDEIYNFILEENNLLAGNVRDMKDLFLKLAKV